MELLLVVTFIVLVIMVSLHFGLHSAQKWLTDEMAAIRMRASLDFKTVFDELKSLRQDVSVLMVSKPIDSGKDDAPKT